jgi:hypothetical protein
MRVPSFLAVVLAVGLCSPLNMGEPPASPDQPGEITELRAVLSEARAAINGLRGLERIAEDARQETARLEALLKAQEQAENGPNPCRLARSYSGDGRGRRPR